MKEIEGFGGEMEKENNRDTKAEVLIKSSLGWGSSSFSGSCSLLLIANMQEGFKGTVHFQP